MAAVQQPVYIYQNCPQCYYYIAMQKQNIKCGIVKCQQIDCETTFCVRCGAQSNAQYHFRCRACTDNNEYIEDIKIVKQKQQKNVQGLKSESCETIDID